jgi:hypothetical protein
MTIDPRPNGVSARACVALSSCRADDANAERLKQQERHLDQHTVEGLAPILFRAPDRANGEVFPAIWYASSMALIGMQHLMVAKMIMIAESPFLGYDFFSLSDEVVTDMQVLGEATQMQDWYFAKPRAKSVHWCWRSAVSHCNTLRPPRRLSTRPLPYSCTAATLLTRGKERR